MRLNITVILLILVVLFGIVVINISTNNCLTTTEHMINIPTLDKNVKWSRNTKCKYYMDDTTSKALNQANVEKTTDHKDADFYFPCGYNDINNEIKQLPKVENGDSSVKRVFIIDGADEITAKNSLWKNILNHHGLRKAKELTPTTYLLVGSQKFNDIKRLESDHYDGKMYIMKKNIQRQTGLKITDDLDTIKTNTDNYVLAQELLQDSYLVNGRKINLRVYVTVVCNKNDVDVYMFNNGFMYYTKEKFIKGDKNADNHITTGYVDRDVYDKNPLTHEDFKKYLDVDEKYHPSNDKKNLSFYESNIRRQGLMISDVVFKRIEKLLADVFVSFKGQICRKIGTDGKQIPIYNDYSVQVFGADVAINDQLQPQIIEINKGPDLSPKDDRDGVVKRRMFNDVLEVLGVKPKSKDNGLILILEM